MLIVACLLCFHRPGHFSYFQIKVFMNSVPGVKAERNQNFKGDF